MLALFLEQPRAFYMIFLLEIWERFGFYTMQGILTLYFIRFLGFDDELAYYTFGAFSALVYGMVAAGGYLGDKVLGAKRTIVLGLICMGLGYLALALSTKQTVFQALGLICVGNGLFKANPASLLAKCYEKQDYRLYSGFTLYYMAVNLGSMVALFAGPALSSHVGYAYAFYLSFIGILLGLVNYWFQYPHIAHINTPIDKHRIPFWLWVFIFIGIAMTTYAAAYLLQHVLLAKNLVWIVTLMVIIIYGVYMQRENRAVRLRMALAFILMIEGVIFFVLYQQMPTSINLFAVYNVYPQLLGIPIDPQSFQALNPIWIIIMSVVLAKLYQSLYRRGISFPIPYKFAFGMTLCGLSFLILYFSRFAHDSHGIVSSWWLIGSYLSQSVGELLVSALGVAMVAELVPGSISGFVMGMWFLTMAVAGFLGAYVASFAALPKNVKPGMESLMIYTKVFAYIGLITLGVALLLWLLSPYLTRLIGTSHRA